LLNFNKNRLMFREITKISSKNFAKSRKFCPNFDFVFRENFAKLEENFAKHEIKISRNFREIAKTKSTGTKYKVPVTVNNFHRGFLIWTLSYFVLYFVHTVHRTYIRPSMKILKQVEFFFLTIFTCICVVGRGGGSPSYFAGCG
jgi:hypothetical protein